MHADRIRLTRADLQSLVYCARVRAEDCAVQIINLRCAGKDVSALEREADEAQRVVAKVTAVLSFAA